MSRTLDGIFFGEEIYWILAQKRKSCSMVMKTTVLCFLAGLLLLATAHTHHNEVEHELSDLYRLYQKTSIPKKCEPQTRDVELFSSSEESNVNPFFAPLPQQSHADFHPQLRILPKASDPITYYSWHIHVYFFQEDKNVTHRALALREVFMNKFNVPKCTGNCFMGGPFDNCTQGICVWDPVFGVDGPHPYGQWGVYLPNENLAETLSWLSQNHGEFPVLFHPNTGLMVGDHDPNRRAIWIKQQVPLDLDFLIWLQVCCLVYAADLLVQMVWLQPRRGSSCVTVVELLS